jgi:hypothetical protein
MLSHLYHPGEYKIEAKPCQDAELRRFGIFWGTIAENAPARSGSLAPPFPTKRSYDGAAIQAICAANGPMGTIPTKRLSSRHENRASKNG